LYLCLLRLEPLPDLGLIPIKGPFGILLRKLRLLLHPRCLDLVIFDHALAHLIFIFLVLKLIGDSLRSSLILHSLVLGALVVS
jgi:hypothetical protein